MKLVFGRVPKEFEDDMENFHGINAKTGESGEFYYKLEVQDEADEHGSFSITDGCNRFVPFDFEQLDELADVINTLKAFRDDKRAFISYWKTQFGQP